MRIEEAGAAPPVQGDVLWPPARQGWAMVATLFIIYIVSLLDRSVFNLLGEHIKHDLRLTDIELSLLFGPAFALAYAVGGMPLGWALDRYSRRMVIWGAVSLWSIGAVSCGLARGFPQLFAARSLIGVGESAMVPANQSVLSDMFPPERVAFPFAVYSIGATAGMGISLGIGGLLTHFISPAALYQLPLIGSIKGWQAIFILIGLPGPLIATSIFLLREPPRQLTSTVGPTGFLDYWRHLRRNGRFFLALNGAGIMATLVSQSLFAWTPIFFMRMHHWSVAQTGFWLGAMMVAGPSIGLPLHGLLAGRLLRRGMRDGNLRYLVWSFPAAAIPLVLGYLSPTPWAGLALICLGQTVLISFYALMPAGLMSMVPSEMRGKAAALFQLVTAGAGMVVGPTIIAATSGLLGGPEHLGGALALCVAIGLPVGAACYWVALKPLRAGPK
jgi:MFS family permease